MWSTIVLKHVKRLIFWSLCPLLSRDSGTRWSRLPALSLFRTMMSDGLWRESLQGPCSCPGSPADTAHRTDQRMAPSPAPHTLSSNTPEVWGLWPATSPEPSESWLLCVVTVLLSSWYIFHHSHQTESISFKLLSNFSFFVGVYV